MAPYYGKYRGRVVNNLDPMQQGRIQAVVPFFGEEPLGWALPCVPCSVLGPVLTAVPSIGANVWIEFEQGDVDYPIWSGCF
jgi:Type VI secretion system/phage-baseplate injector OB domain